MSVLKNGILWKVNLERPKVLYNEKTKKFVMWAPNQGKYAVADSMDGSWSTLTEIGDGTTYQSQPAFIIHWNGRILYYGDRWGGDGGKYCEFIKRFCFLIKVYIKTGMMPGIKTAVVYYDHNYCPNEKRTNLLNGYRSDIRISSGNHAQNCGCLHL